MAERIDNTELDRLLLKTLESIPADYRSTEGICHYIGRKFPGDEDDWIRCKLGRRFIELAAGWPEFTGRRIFPVPHGDFVSATAIEKWDESHPYGAARWRLIRWMIRNLSLDND